MDMSLYLTIALGAVVAGFVQGLSGFAFGLVAMSFWAWTVDPRLAAVLATAGALTGQLIAAFTVRRGFNKALLVLWCPAMLFSRNLPKVTAGGRWADAFAGWMGGVMGGIGGFAGAVPTLWCTLRGMEKDVQRAVVQNFNLTMLSVAFALQLGTGLVTSDMLPLIAMVAVCVLVPVLLGARLYIGISEANFRKIVLGLLTASGVALLASSLPVLLRNL